MKAATAKDYMATKLITFRPDQDIHKAIRLLLRHRLSGAPVLDEEGCLVGMLTKKDCLAVAFRAGYHRDWAGSVAEYMHGDVQTVSPDTSVIRVAELFIQGMYGRFPVVDGGRLVGQISRHDVLRALHELW